MDRVVRVAPVALRRAVALSALFCAFSQAHAEEFLVCRDGSESATTARQNPSALSKVSAQKTVRQILHTFAGDDLSAYFGVTPAVIVLPESAPNAFMSGSDQIILTKGLFSVLESTDELAFVVAHELGHLKLGHSTASAKSRPALVGRGANQQQLIEHEVQADRFAINLLVESGFDPHAGMNLLGRMMALVGGIEDPTASKSYPSLNTRIAALQTAFAGPQCSIVVS